jgi:hypothetical protein
MARKNKHGGATWVAVKERDDNKVRCRACSSVMFISQWWKHKCLDTVVDDAPLQSGLTKNPLD